MKPAKHLPSSAKLAPSQQPLAVQRIAIIGAECTGKTTLGLALAKHLPGIYVPETLRAFCTQKGRTPRVDEQRLIMQDQLQEESLALLRARHSALPWVVSDSSPLITALYSLLYFEDDRLLTRGIAHQRSYGATLLMNKDLPWVADGIQRDGPQVQASAHEKLLRLLEEQQIPYTLISGPQEARLTQALEIVKELLVSSPLKLDII